MTDAYDVSIIARGASGGTLAWKLPASGRRTLPVDPTITIVADSLRVGERITLRLP